MAIFTAIFAISVFATIIWYQFGNKSSPQTCSSSAHISVHELREAVSLLKSSKLEHRAFPNQRLVKAFGLENSFTTTGKEYHDVFVNLAKKKLRMLDSDWKEVASLACSPRFNYELFKSNHNRSESTEHWSANLVNLVQGLVFRVVMFKFFPDTAEPSFDDTNFLTTAINDLWVGSKCCTTHDQNDQIRMKAELATRLETVFQSPITGRGNPLNILLPAYETLWRVVLHCFLEVRFRASEEQLASYRNLFKSFLANPTKTTLENSVNGISVKNIVAEALRLYPPTRRINRQVGPRYVRIDVERIQRDPEYWGQDALEFSPRRWELVTQRGAQAAYMPFGAGAFECPAKNVFAPMMIGILVGSLLEEFDSSAMLADVHGTQVALPSGPLSGGRCGCDEMYVKVS